MNSTITTVDALEILDSRGHPTIRARVGLRGGIVATASVPSGAATGENEAVELRDGDPHRYAGKGVLKAVAAVDFIARSITGMDATRQAEIDARLVELDGSPNKSVLGANAILGVSMAVARRRTAATSLP